MKQPLNDNSTVRHLDYDKREETLMRALEDTLYERCTGLTVSAVIGTLQILTEKF